MVSDEWKQFSLCLYHFLDCKHKVKLKIDKTGIFFFDWLIQEFLEMMLAQASSGLNDEKLDIEDIFKVMKNYFSSCHSLMYV